MRIVRLLDRAAIEQEITIVELYRESGTVAGVARQMGLTPYRVGRVLRRAGIAVRPAMVARKLARAGPPPSACRRCEILLSEAPAGRDGLCGWCLMEGTQEDLVA